jgi:hypothetical protein
MIAAAHHQLSSHGCSPQVIFVELVGGTFASNARIAHGFAPKRGLLQLSEKSGAD